MRDENVVETTRKPLRQACPLGRRSRSESGAGRPPAPSLSERERASRASGQGARAHAHPRHQIYRSRVESSSAGEVRARGRRQGLCEFRATLTGRHGQVIGVARHGLARKRCTLEPAFGARERERLCELGGGRPAETDRGESLLSRTRTQRSGPLGVPVIRAEKWRQKGGAVRGQLSRVSVPGELKAAELCEGQTGVRVKRSLLVGPDDAVRGALGGRRRQGAHPAQELLVPSHRHARAPTHGRAPAPGALPAARKAKCRGSRFAARCSHSLTQAWPGSALCFLLLHLSLRPHREEVLSLATASSFRSPTPPPQSTRRPRRRSPTGPIPTPPSHGQRAGRRLRPEHALRS